MILKAVKESPVFLEFSPERQKEFFNMKKEAVTSHVDTLYYTVTVYGDSNEPEEPMTALLSQLEAFRVEKSKNYSNYVEFFGLSVENIRFANYEYCLRLNETFDIFFAKYLPNVFTPRIVVQLRTRSLVLDGTCQAVCKSFKYVQDILGAFGLEVDSVNENRIDYAFHTNLIQNPYKFFNDDYLLKSMKTKHRLFTKVGNIGSKIEIDYLSLGSRRSNDIFIRIYNKSREVVEKNYKSFFLDKWLQDGLICNYDYYVYKKAYEMGSYVTGMLVGRIDWYLEYGSDEKIKEKLTEVKQSCYVNSDNTEQLKKIVDTYLPPVTLIMNIEFQTKRKFYMSTNDFINSHGIFRQIDDYKSEFVDTSKLPLLRLWNIISLRSQYCDYLTGTTLYFVEDKSSDNEKMCYWWKRIHGCFIEEYDKRVLDLWRIHDRNINFDKSKRRCCSTIAQLSIIHSGDVRKDTPCNFVDDISDVLCSLNDNDFYGFAANPETGLIPELNPKEYQIIKTRKKRQYKGIFNQIKNNENFKEKESE